MIPSITTTIQKIKLAREGAGVRRCHTAMVLGEYNVGYHTFNMLAMLRMLWPDAPRDLIWAILEHDLPERVTGDIPSPAKWYGMVDRDKLNAFEDDYIDWLFGWASSKRLGEVESGWLVGLDLLELYLWCKDQVSLGNSNAAVMQRRSYEHMKKVPNIPIHIREMFAQAERMTWIFQEDL